MTLSQERAANSPSVDDVYGVVGPLSLRRRSAGVPREQQKRRADEWETTIRVRPMWRNTSMPFCWLCQFSFHLPVQLRALALGFFVKVSTDTKSSTLGGYVCRPGPTRRPRGLSVLEDLWSTRCMPKEGCTRTQKKKRDRRKETRKDVIFNKHRSLQTLSRTPAEQRPIKHLEHLVHPRDECPLVRKKRKEKRDKQGSLTGRGSK